MSMQRVVSLFWILFLLVALFVGPAVLVQSDVESHDIPSLQAVLEAERLLDAPAPLPARPDQANDWQ